MGVPGPRKEFVAAVAMGQLCTLAQSCQSWMIVRMIAFIMPFKQTRFVALFVSALRGIARFAGWLVGLCLVLLVRAYQVAIRPHLSGACQFYPTCSEYAVGAVREHGCLRGIRLAMRRVSRCRPLSPGGYDPVPPAGPRAVGNDGGYSVARKV